MAATKFSAIYVNNEGKIIEREIPGMNTYKIAEKFAKIYTYSMAVNMYSIQSLPYYPSYSCP